MFKKLIIFIFFVPGFVWAKTLEDPTKPPAYRAISVDKEDKAVEPDTFKLSSILLSPTRKIAVINGEKYSEGGKIGEYQIQSIDNYQVTLISATEKKVITLGANRLEKRYQKPDKGVEP